jgi:diguanylate cyclase (GGDEF)-like protein
MAGDTILVIDDNRRFLEKTEEILRDAGYRPVIARDPDEALDVLRESNPSVVLASSSLAGRKGIELARDIKANYDPQIPVVLIYGTDEGDQAERQRRSGDMEAESWLVRPLKRTEVLAQVRNMLTIRKLRQRINAQREDNSGPVTVNAKPGGPGPEAAVFDPESGFYTFQAFKEVLFREVKRAKRHGFAISVAMVALDAGEEVTDADDGSHPPTERVSALSAAIRASLRDTDIPVAYGKGQTLILLPHTELTGGVAVARRIQQKIGKARLKVGKKLTQPTISVGLAASTNLKDFSFGDLMKSASRALSGAVEAGGNKILFEQSMAETG